MSDVHEKVRTISKYRKLVGAVLGGVTAAMVTAIATLAGVDMEPTLAVSVAVMLSSLGAYLAPANAAEAE